MAVVCLDNNNELASFVVYHPHGFVTKNEMIKGFEYSAEIVDRVVDDFEKRTPDMKDSYNLDFVFAMKNHRGKNLGSRMCKRLSEFLNARKECSFFYIYVSGVKLL